MLLASIPDLNKCQALSIWASTVDLCKTRLSGRCILFLIFYPDGLVFVYAIGVTGQKFTMSQPIPQRPLLVRYYERYLVDQDISNYIRNIRANYTTGGLERVAASGDRTARRGAVLAIGRIADYSTNAILGRALVDSDRGVRTLAENGIRRLWIRVGTPAQQRHLLVINEDLENQEFERAAQIATALVQDAPWIAQGWYYRGKAFFQLGQYEAASRDCHQALEINACHFLAASIMGQSYQLLENPVAALEAFRHALRLNPSMEEVRAQVIHLQRTLKGK